MAAHILKSRSCAKISSVTTLRPSSCLLLHVELSLEPATVRAFRHRSRNATEQFIRIEFSPFEINETSHGEL